MKFWNLINQKQVSNVWDIATDGWINKYPDGTQLTVQDRKGHLPTDLDENWHSESYSSSSSKDYSNGRQHCGKVGRQWAALLHKATGGLPLDGWVPTIDKVRPHLRQTFYILRNVGLAIGLSELSNSSLWIMDWLTENCDSIVKAWGPGAVLLL